MKEEARRKEKKIMNEQKRHNVTTHKVQQENNGKNGEKNCSKEIEKKK